MFDLRKYVLAAGLTAAAAVGLLARSAKLEPSRTVRNLRGHVEFLASEKLEGRRTGSEGARSAAAYIANQFAKLKLKPGAADSTGKSAYLQEFPHTRQNMPPVIGYNVVGVLEGRDKELRKEAVVIGAHYDHLGRGGDGSLAVNSTEVHHGADDNASGTAALIELARRFAQDRSNKRTMIFVAFSGEEEGLFGSKHFVNHPVFPVESIAAMINLDMVGRLKDDKLTIGGIGTATEWREILERLNVGPTKFMLALNEDGFGPSDHSSFYTKKIPVLFFFTGTHLDYHKPSDTADKINYEGQERIVNYVASIARTVDQNALRPSYLVAKSASPTGGRAGFNITLGTIPGYSDSADGMVIDGVRDDSPASRAGLRANDKIVMLAGMEVKNVQDYTRLLGEMKADVEYEIIVVRDGQRLNLKITPAKRQ